MLDCWDTILQPVRVGYQEDNSIVSTAFHAVDGKSGHYARKGLQLNLSTSTFGAEESGRCGEVAVVERWPLWRGGRCREVAVVERRRLWRGGGCGEVAVVERWRLWRGGGCGEVAVVERWPLWGGRGVIWHHFFGKYLTCLLCQVHAYCNLWGQCNAMNRKPVKLRCLLYCGIK